MGGGEDGGCGGDVPVAQECDGQWPASQKEACGRRRCLIPIKEGQLSQAGDCSPLPSGVAAEINDFPLLFFGGMTCKERLSERNAKAIHYRKICSLVTSSDNPAPGKLALWGPGLAHTGAGPQRGRQSLRSPASAAVTSLLQIRAGTGGEGRTRRTPARTIPVPGPALPQLEVSRGHGWGEGGVGSPGWAVHEDLGQSPSPP